MSLIAGESFISEMAGSLRNFKKEGMNKYICSCPICGDSAKDSSAARGNFFIYNQVWKYHCYNCGETLSLGPFIKTQFPLLYDKYLTETLGDSFAHKKRKPRRSKKPHNGHSMGLRYKTVLSALNPLSGLPVDHPANVYLFDKRKIPSGLRDKFYYTDDFKGWVNEVLPGTFDVVNTEERIVIPFFNKSGLIYAFQGRAMSNDVKPKYITLKFNEDHHKIWNLDFVDTSRNVYVFEGLINSLFIENSVATNDASLTKISDYIKDPILVWDNDPRNKQIVAHVELALLKGFRVCIWPFELPTTRDVNDLILNYGYSGEDIRRIIDESTYQGLRGRLEFSKWAKR